MVHQNSVQRSFEEIINGGLEALDRFRNAPNSSPHLNSIITDLIAIYDRPFGRQDLKWHAARLVAALVIRSGCAANLLALVMANAEEYAKHQHIDDAFPYNPNSFDVLADAGLQNEDVRSFLTRVIRDDHGVAQDAAAGALAGGPRAGVVF